MIDMNDAIQRAKTFVQDVYTDEHVQDLSLEEVNKSEDGKFWLITIGFSAPRKPTAREALLNQMLGGAGHQTETPPLERLFKVVAVDVSTGHVESMKIREG